MNTDEQKIGSELLKRRPREWKALEIKDGWVFEDDLFSLVSQLTRGRLEECALNIHMNSTPHLLLSNCKLLLVKNNPGEKVTLVVSSTKGASVRYYRIVYLPEVSGVQHDKIRGLTLAFDRTGYRQATIQELEPTVSSSN